MQPVQLQPTEAGEIIGISLSQTFTHVYTYAFDLLLTLANLIKCIMLAVFACVCAKKKNKYRRDFSPSGGIHSY